MPKNRESVDFSTEDAQKEFEQLPQEDQRHIQDRARKMAQAADPAYVEARQSREKLDRVKSRGLESSDEWYQTLRSAELSEAGAERREVEAGAAFELEQIPQERLAEEYERVKRRFEQVYEELHANNDARMQAEKEGNHEEHDRLRPIVVRLYREVEHLDALRGKIWHRLQSEKGQS